MGIIVPAGHARVIANKAHSSEHISDLEKAFKEWQRFSSYETAYKLLEGTHPDTADLHRLVLQHHDPLNAFAGIFLSAGYSVSDENIIRYDLDIPLGELGYRLPEDKLFVNLGCAGALLGQESKGVIVNAGTAGGFFGECIEGVAVNAGYADWGFGYCRTGGIAVAVHAPTEYDNPREGGTLITHDGIGQELRSYLEQLIDTCKGPAESIYRNYGHKPGGAISYDVRQILNYPEANS